MSSDDSHEEGGAGQERWLVSYADFITLMFAFFTVLYATSNKDTEKTKEFQESIKKYLIKAGAFGESGQTLQQGIKHNSPIEPPITTYKDTKPEAVAMLDQAEAFVESQITDTERKKFILDVGADEWGVRIVLPSAAIYSQHSEKFREDALPFVAKLAGLLAKTKRKVLIEGHVAQGERGAYKSTWDFASARAVNMLRYMEQKEKIASKQLAAASFADSRPAYEGERTPSNSRIEIVLLNPDMEL